MRRLGSRPLGWIAGSVAVAITVLNLALWLLYRDSRHNLESQLGQRLEEVVAVLARRLDPALVTSALREFTAHTARGAPPESLLVASAYDSLHALLRDVSDDTQLADVRLLDANGVVFFDLAAGPATAGTPEDLDPAGVLAALAGSTNHGDLYRSGSDLLMAGYAPVRDREGNPVAALVVEADARFFAALRRLRLAMVASGVLSAVVLLGLGAGFARLQASLQRAEAAVQRAETLAAMGRMAAGIAHEIRNPLGIIKATAARLRKRYDDPQHPDERFAYIDEEVDRVDGILTGYLQFARDEPAAMRRLDLVAIVRRSLELLRPELENAAVQVEVETPASCAVHGDSQRLQQVFMNLVLNAMQAMARGGRLQVRLTAAGGVARLAFADSGPGFDPAVRARLFEPFVTTKERGSGLGLAIAKRIVEEHGGRIGVLDAPAVGACVELELPLA